MEDDRYGSIDDYIERSPYKAIKRQERTRKLSYTKLKKQNPFTRAANIEPNFHVSNENDSEVII